MIMIYLAFFTVIKESFFDSGLELCWNICPCCSVQKFICCIQMSWKRFDISNDSRIFSSTPSLLSMPIIEIHSVTKQGLSKRNLKMDHEQTVQRPRGTSSAFIYLICNILRKRDLPLVFQGLLDNYILFPFAGHKSQGAIHPSRLRWFL